MRNLLLFLFLSFVLLGNSQSDISYAKKVVDTLASKYMFGRGYVADGDKIAATYIAEEFERFGVKSLTENYFQKFSFPVNTFPGRMEVRIDGEILIPGKDYIVKSSSKGLTGKFSVIRYTETNLPGEKSLMKAAKRNFFHDKAVVIDESVLANDEAFEGIKYNHFGIPLLVSLEPEKLTWSVSTKLDEYTTIQILKENFANGAKEIFVDIEQVFNYDHQTQNVLGYILGKKNPDSSVVFMAHYDHLGMMGEEACFYGANDNASGIAMLLHLANYYTQNPPDYTVVFIAFAGEEAGLLGSAYLTKNPLLDLRNTKFFFNFDILGTGDEGIKVVNGAVFEKEFAQLQEINSTLNLLPKIEKRGKAAISDHYFFTEQGVHGFYIYTLGGIKAYHDIYDKPETLPLTEFQDLSKLIIKFIEEL